MAAQFEDIPLQKGDDNPQSTAKSSKSGETVLNKSKKTALIVVFVVLILVILILLICLIVIAANYSDLKGKTLFT